ncbi:hypothetical protein [Streptomyces sp. URMC 125]|uniref:hypothetical protein n=1 Tax=Streptomyces sp. URMC 125 TaxID=3423419 RepID=UPI003F1E32D1
MRDTRGYRDIKKASEDTYKAIWGTWLVVGILAWTAAFLSEGVPILGTVMEYVAVYGWIPATIIAVGASVMVAVEEDRARRRTLDR